MGGFDVSLSPTCKRRPLLPPTERAFLPVTNHPALRWGTITPLTTGRFSMSLGPSRMHPRRSRIAAASALTLLLLVVAGSASAAQRAPSFRDVVRRNFAKWDRNWDGLL